MTEASGCGLIGWQKTDVSNRMAGKGKLANVRVVAISPVGS